MTYPGNGITSQRSKALKATLVVLIAIGIGILAFTVWPTLYRYDHLKVSGDVYPVRIHRFTGKTEILSGEEGWMVLSKEQSSSSKPMPGDQLVKLDGNLAVTSHGWIKANIYNGTEHDLDGVKIEVTVLDSSGAEVLRREYNLTSTDGSALSSSEFIANCGFELAPGQTYQWKILSATWK